MEICHDYSGPRFCDVLTTVELYDMPMHSLKTVMPEANLDKRSCIYANTYIFAKEGLIKAIST